MPIIHLWTEIKAKRTLVFDLSRSIDLHQLSTKESNETAIAGMTSGIARLLLPGFDRSRSQGM